MKDLNFIKGDKNLKQLFELSQKERIVPFIGAGFSSPCCPTWAKFLEVFFQGILRDDFLLAEEEKHYRQLEISDQDNRFEAMADFLVEKAGRRKFEEEMKTQFDTPLLSGMRKKFQLLHLAFPGLKITTNFDCLIENSSPNSNVKICCGDNLKELQRLVTHWEQNSLLKVHGDLLDIHSIVLSTSQYAALYGDAKGYDPEAPFPVFLKRLFTNASVLFIGCSLIVDRTIMIMNSLLEMRQHFAIMRRPDDHNNLVILNRRLSNSGINPIWIKEYEQIDEILEGLAGQSIVKPVSPPIDHGATFVGREKELREIQENLKKDSGKGSLQMITGRLFNIDGAGGVGKTTLAIEAATKFASFFKDGVLSPIRVDEHTPVSFAMQLASQLNLSVDEPGDANEAQRLVTAILKERHVLLVLDNAVEWQSLKYMLPFDTCSAILVTTRNRDMYNHLRLQFRNLIAVHEIPLEKFTPEEALELFRQMLGRDYLEKDEKIYLEISANLGFLPLALRQAIVLMLFGPHYTASRLRDKLKNENRLELLREGKAVEDSDCKTVESVFDLSSPILTPELTETLEILAVCSPGPVPLDFLQRMLNEETIGEQLEQLYAISWCERREVDGQRGYELHQLVRELVKRRFGDEFRDIFIQTVHDIFLDESIHFDVKDKLILQLEEALVLAEEDEDDRLKEWLYKLYDFCIYRGHGDFYLRLTKSVEKLFFDDKGILIDLYIKRAIVFGMQGKLKEAMKFHKKAGRISEEMGFISALALCYGNQGSILCDWGKFKEGMRLLKKEENLCLEWRDRKGLARSYNNQAGIYQRQGKLEEAMRYFKYVEKVSQELKDRAGLAACYGNQAVIVKDWGSPGKAIELLKMQEAIFEELGDNAGLAACYENQAQILCERGELEKAMRLHKMREILFEKLGNRIGIVNCYGDQAWIHKLQGNLEESKSLYKQVELLYEELGNRIGLADCYVNQSIIFSEQSNFNDALILLKKAEKIYKEVRNRFGLANSYYYQGRVHWMQNKLEDAMTLYNKSESVSEQLKDLSGLARCYTAQALLLEDSGKFDEALRLHKKSEINYNELGERSEMAGSYFNQAKILHNLGKHKEAMRLYNMAESLFEELDNCSGIAASCQNQAIIYRIWGELKQSMMLLKKVENIHEELGEQGNLAFCYSNQAVILRIWGKLEEAMELHKKEENIYERLGSRAGLASAYENQAVILGFWGRFEEAMDLHKEVAHIFEGLKNPLGLASSYYNQVVILFYWGKLEEAIKRLNKVENIYEELGHRSGLASCYEVKAEILRYWGRLEEAMSLLKKAVSIYEELAISIGLPSCYQNQAVILRKWGKLEEAMELHKKEEAIYDRMGFRIGLAESYGNQGVILRKLGQLEEAMELHKKEEAIYDRMGFRIGLAESYGNQGIILRKWGQLEEAMGLHKKEEKIFDGMGFRIGLAESYGNQALIMSNWGKIDEAMSLHKKEENLCKKLGDRVGLARTWWNQGEIYGKEGNYNRQVELWQKSIKMNKEIGIPIEKNEKELDGLMKKIKTY